MTGQPRLAVLLACHNRRSKTLPCLQAVLAQSAGADLHVFVYDDGSTDGTAAAVTTLCPAATILHGTGHAYWAGGMRAAFDFALAQDFDGYLWLNDDVILDRDAVARLLVDARDSMRARPGPLLVGGAVRDPSTGMVTYGGVRRRVPGRSPLRFVAVSPFAAESRRVDTLNGNVVLIPRETARAIGSIDPVYVHTLGDLDYGLRVRRAGGTVLLAPGTFGTCARNPRALRFFDPATPLLIRWRQLADPRGFPLRPWLHFARMHGGPLWLIFALLPLLRLCMPARGGRAKPDLMHERSHAA